MRESRKITKFNLKYASLSTLGNIRTVVSKIMSLIKLGREAGALNRRRMSPYVMLKAIGNHWRVENIGMSQ